MFLDRLNRTQGLIYLNDCSVEVRRVDTYGIPARWFWQTLEEVEVWELVDGRRVKASRRGEGDWKVTWVPKHAVGASSLAAL